MKNTICLRLDENLIKKVEQERITIEPCPNKSSFIQYLLECGLDCIQDDEEY